MSFSNAPDDSTLGRVAGALSVDEAFIEKDWFVVEAIRHLLALKEDSFTPVFSGGTALLKGHQIIKRFSEDIDFKLQLSEAFSVKSRAQQRKVLSKFKDVLAETWETAGFAILNVAARDANAFIQFELGYPSIVEGNIALRPHILAELSAKPPHLSPIERSVSSFVAQYRRQAPEISAILCVDPVETAADKLSAFAWRAIARVRGDDRDDPTIVRHIHDLALLERIAASSPQFGALLAHTLERDTDRGQGAVQNLPPKERLEIMLAALATDNEYEAEYRHFVEAMAFSTVDEIPDFNTAVKSLRRLSELLPD